MAESVCDLCLTVPLTSCQYTTHSVEALHRRRGQTVQLYINLSLCQPACPLTYLLCCLFVCLSVCICQYTIMPVCIICTCLSVCILSLLVYISAGLSLFIACTTYPEGRLFQHRHQRCSLCDTHTHRGHLQQHH